MHTSHTEWMDLNILVCNIVAWRKESREQKKNNVSKYTILNAERNAHLTEILLTTTTINWIAICGITSSVIFVFIYFIFFVPPFHQILCISWQKLHSFNFKWCIKLHYNINTPNSVYNNLYGLKITIKCACGCIDGLNINSRDNNVIQNYFGIN